MIFYHQRTKYNFERVLITGASGFTGQHLINHILSTGKPSSVFGFDLKKKAILGCETFVGDITHKEDIDKVIEHVKPDCVIHLAASFSTHNYQAAFLVNTIGTLNLLESLRTHQEANLPRILIVGSSAEYGLTLEEELPISEKSPLRPLSHYGTSKVAQSFIGLQYYLSWRLPIILSRTFNLVGPGLSSNFLCGSLVEQFIDIENKRKKPVLSMGNLTSQRDFVDVRDVVQAYWDIISLGTLGEIYNVCSGEAHSVQNIIEILKKLSGLNVNIQQTAARKQIIDVPMQVGSYAKINKEIGWQPNFNISNSLEDMLQWQRRKALNFAKVK